MRLPKLQFLRSLLLSRRAMLLSFLAFSLAGCQTFTTVPAPAAKALACDTFGTPLTYDTTRDTVETYRQDQVKNKAFSNIGCF